MDAEARANSSRHGADLTGWLTIGEAARRSGFSVRTLRFYERGGLLPPATRTPSGYRVYTDTDLGRLEFIREAKALGLSLRDIRELVATTKTRSCRATRPLLIELLDTKIKQADEQVRMLARLKRRLRQQRRAILARPPSDHRRGYCSCLIPAAISVRLDQRPADTT